MSVVLGQLGAYAFTLTVSAGESLAGIKLALNSYIELTDWEVWDADYLVYRCVNLDGSYKYLRIVVDDTTGIAYTQVYATWNADTHIGTNVASHTIATTPANDSNKTGFYLTHSTQQVVIHVYVHPHWLLVGSVLGTSNKFGLPNTWTGSVNNSGSYRADANLTFSGIGGCLEVAVPTNTTGITCTPFIWFHTAWSVFDMYMESEADTGGDTQAWRAYSLNVYNLIFGARTDKAFARIPKNTSGIAGDVSVSSMLFRSVGQLRSNVSSESLSALWSARQPISDLYIRDMSNGNPIGGILGLKAMRAGPNTFGQQISLETDSTFFLKPSGTPHSFALLHTEVSTYLSWTEWAWTYAYSTYGSYAWIPRGAYSTTLTPKFFIPIN